MEAAGLIAARGLHFAAVTALFGLALFRLYAPRTARVPLAALPRAAAAVALAAGAAWLVFSAAAMGGGLATVSDTLPTVMTGTDFGPIWAGRLVLAAVLCAPAFDGRPRLHAALAAVLLASVALTGHARMHDGATGWLQAAGDAVHLLAAGTWLGALTAFVVLLRRAAWDPETLGALADFSRVGMAAVAALLLTGILNGGLILGGWKPLFATLYGRLLLLKVGLFAAMVALAADNRLRLVPAATRADRAALLQLRGHVMAEQVLGLAVLAIVAALGTLDPAA